MSMIETWIASQVTSTPAFTPDTAIYTRLEDGCTFRVRWGTRNLPGRPCETYLVISTPDGVEINERQEIVGSRLARLLRAFQDGSSRLPSRLVIEW